MRLFLAFITCQIALVLTSAFLTAKSKAILASYSSLFAKVPERKRDERSMKSTTTKKSYSTSKPRVMYKASPKPAVIAKSVVEIVSNLKDDESDVKELVKLDDEERLQKVIARAGIASRRKAEELVSSYGTYLHPLLFYD